MSAKQPHTACPRGQRVKVVLRNGKQFIAKFMERRSHRVIFDDREVRRGDIAQFTIVKGAA